MKKNSINLGRVLLLTAALFMGSQSFGQAPSESKVLKTYVPNICLQGTYPDQTKTIIRSWEQGKAVMYGRYKDRETGYLQLVTEDNFNSANLTTVAPINVNITDMEVRGDMLVFCGRERPGNRTRSVVGIADLKGLIMGSVEYRTFPISTLSSIPSFSNENSAVLDSIINLRDVDAYQVGDIIHIVAIGETRYKIIGYNKVPQYDTIWGWPDVDIDIPDDILLTKKSGEIAKAGDTNFIDRRGEILSIETTYVRTPVLQPGAVSAIIDLAWDARSNRSKCYYAMDHMPQPGIGVGEKYSYESMAVTDHYVVVMAKSKIATFLDPLHDEICAITFDKPHHPTIDESIFSSVAPASGNHPHLATRIFSNSRLHIGTYFHARWFNRSTGDLFSRVLVSDAGEDRVIYSTVGYCWWANYTLGVNPSQCYGIAINTFKLNTGDSVVSGYVNGAPANYVVHGSYGGYSMSNEKWIELSADSIIKIKDMRLGDHIIENVYTPDPDVPDGENVPFLKPGDDNNYHTGDIPYGTITYTPNAVVLFDMLNSKSCIFDFKDEHLGPGTYHSATITKSNLIHGHLINSIDKFIFRPGVSSQIIASGINRDNNNHNTESYLWKYNGLINGGCMNTEDHFFHPGHLAPPWQHIVKNSLFDFEPTTNTVVTYNCSRDTIFLECESHGNPHSKSLSNTIAQNASISLYPNPASQQIEITCVEDMSRIEIWSIDGKKVMDKEVFGGHEVVNVSNLTPGAYIAHITHDGGVENVKLIIK